MTKVKFLLKNKSIVLSILLILLTVDVAWTQCTNPVPTGDSSQEFCKIDYPSINDLVVSGGLIEWYEAAAGGVKLSGTHILENGVTYYADDVADSNCSTSRLAVTVTLNGLEPTNVDVFVGKCASEGATISQLTADGTNIEWYTESTGGVLLDPTSLLEDGVTYWVQQTYNGCTSPRLPTTVSLIDQPAPAVEPVQSFCTENPVTVGDLSPNDATILWYASETSTSPLDNAEELINGEDYWAVKLSFPCESTERAQTTVTIETPPDAGENGSLTFCELDPTVENLYNLLGGTPDPTGTWSGPSDLTGGIFDSATNIEGVYTYTVSTGTGICPDVSATVTVTINRTPPATISNSDQNFCEIDNPTVADLVASGNNILWYDTETDTVPLNVTDALIDGEDYWATQTDPVTGCESATRVVASAIITVVPPPTVSNSDQTFCSIDNATIADLAITGTNVVWYDSELGTTALTSTDALVDGEDYWAAEIGANGCESATRVVINVTIIDVATPTTTNPAQDFCTIDQPTVADIQINETNIVWYDAQTGGNLVDSTTALTNGTSYFAVQVLNNCESPNRLEITVAVNDTPPPTTANPTQTFCDLDAPTVADLDITGNSVSWYDSETSTTALNTTDALVDGQTYWAADTDSVNGCLSSTRTSVVVTITTTPPPTVSNTDQTFCSIDNATIADLAITGTNIVWYDSELGTTPLTTTDALVDGEDYWAAEIGADGCESSTRVVINVTIIDVATPTTTEPAPVFCAVDQPTVADLQINETTIVWYDAATGGNVVDSTTALTNATSYFAAQIENNCESPVRLEITVTVNDTPAPTGNAAQTFCDIDAPTVADLVITGTSVSWYDSETSTTALNATDTLVNGQVYWASDTGANGCESAVRLAVTVTVISVTPPTVSNTAQTFCSIDNATIADIAVTGTNVVWYADEFSTTDLLLTDALVDGEDYWAAEIGSNGCESATRVVVTVTILDVAAPTTSDPAQEFCAVDQPTLADVQVNETSIVWYDAQTGGNLIDSTTALTNGSSYWAAQVVNGCESPIRLEITVTVNDIAAPTTAEPTPSFCELDNPTIGDLSVNETDVVWYASETDTTPLNTSDVITVSATYWVAQLDTTTGCESSTRLAIVVDITSSAVPTAADPTQEFCLIDNPTVADLQANEANVFWYANLGDTTPLSTTDALVDGAQYYGSFFDAASPCEGPDRLVVSVVINDPATPTSANTNPTFCTNSNPTISLLEVNETDVIWYSSETDTTALSIDTLLTDGGEYWAALNDATTGCIGTGRLQFTVTLVDPGTPVIAAQDLQFCKIDTPTIGDLEDRFSVAAGSGIVIMDAPDGYEFTSGELLVHGKTYYAVIEDAGGCRSVNHLEITVDLEQCDMYDVKFYDGFSPNGDGINDTFNIQYMKELYPDFRVVFFNRWGAEVYVMNASTPSWNGRLNGTGTFVPSGVYFYVAEFNKDGRKPVQGKLILNR